MAGTDRDYWVDPAETDRRGFWIFGHMLLVATAVIVVAFFVWADHTVIDEVTRGQAKVIPTSQVQMIQNLEGGILSEVLVREGDIVAKDQVVLRIENSLAESNLSDLGQRYLDSLAIVTRLQGEIDGKRPEEIVFPGDLLRDGQSLVEAERANARIRRNQLDSQIAVLRDQVTQREQELTELASKLKNLKQSFALAAEELQILRPLVKDGVVSRVELLRREREVSDLKTEIDATSLSQPRVESALQEANNRIKEHVDTFRTEAATELSRQRLELATVTEQIKAMADRVTRTEVRSPVEGVIKEIKIRTIGGVIKPGDDLIEIVPLEDSLLVEAQVRTSDRGFIAPRQKAVVKIDTYDFSIYGGLDAEVIDISPDAFEEQIGGQRERFFRVRLRTDKNFLGTEANPLQIGPGMTATVDILTGKKTVLAYLLKPVLRIRDNAFGER